MAKDYRTTKAQRRMLEIQKEINDRKLFNRIKRAIVNFYKKILGRG